MLGDFMDYIQGIYIQEIFANSDNGYTVGLVRVKESNNSEYNNRVVTITGVFPSLNVKTNYKFMGEFSLHPKYGKQFNVNSYEIVVPTDREELIEFLSSDLFPIGEKTATKIVDKLGVDAIKKINDDETCLSDIPRLGAEKIEKIRNVLKEYESTSEIVLNLSKIGFSTKSSLSILKKMGNKSISFVNNNIYDVMKIIDIPFKEVDSIAINNGYSLCDERRLLSLTIFLMNDITFNNGDTYSYFDELYDSVSRETDGISKDEFEYILLKLNKMHLIKIVDDRYYLSTLYDAEKDIVDRVCLLNNMDRRKLPKLEKKIIELENIDGIKYDDSQKDAIMNAINNNLTIITGGPGTGKTTIIKCIVRLLFDIYKIPDSKLALLAPTGRAARKLMDTTGKPAMTIHRFLKWDKESNTFQINELSPVNLDYVIVDEVSMLDTVLLASLFRGTTVNTKFIFVGDYHQLPSVSQGQVLKDLIDSESLDVIKLTSLYRQSEGSYIVNLAHEIKDNNIDSNFMLKKDDYSFIECDTSMIISIIHDIVLKVIKLDYDISDIQILAPMYKSSVGIDNLNVMLQGIMNPPSDSKNEYLSGDIIYREGDKVLQLVNDYDNNISNGDIGYIESISIDRNTKKVEIKINYDGTYVVYNPKDLINIMHGYAISVHKSQGSEFKVVIMPFAKSFKRMLYNKLIYTGITRAKEKLILVGDPTSFIDGIRNNTLDRKTTIMELIKKRYN